MDQSVVPLSKITDYLLSTRTPLDVAKPLSSGAAVFLSINRM
jgi:hypothetical protein